MSLTDDPKGWARAQVERLRADPKAWALEQGERARKLVDVAPFSDEALDRELLALRTAVDHLDELGADEKVALHDALLQLHERLSPGGALVSGAKIGLAASVLPVVGMITGPILGGAYGVYRSQRLTAVRDEVQGMLRKVVRG
ncbi:MAG: hypothetical protein H6711_04075 [Myxococcales bacterium]|nr:hypothetical protein [Myxococcales bacterium]